MLQWLPLRGTDPDPAPAMEATIAERLAVEQALAALSPKYRVPLVLYLDEGYSVAEIAEILELSQGAVKVRLYRAREQFRQAYLAQTSAPRCHETTPRNVGTRAHVRTREERS